MRYLVLMPQLPWGRSYMYYEIPLGLGYISAALQASGHYGELINTNEYDSDYLDDMLHRKLLNTDIVFTGGLSAHYNSIKNICAFVKRINPNTTVVVGGGIITSMPELRLGDITIAGEGDKSVLEVFKDRTPRHIPAGEYINMDTLPLPDYAGLVGPTWLEKQRPTSNIYFYPFDRPRALPLTTTRGCPFNCSFCFSPLGRRYRERSIPKVLEDIERIKSQFNVNILNIYDEVMSLKRDRLEQFCFGIKKFNIKWVTEFRIELVTRDILRMLKDAGCYLINFGIENVHDDILKSMNKGITRKQIEDTLQLCYDEEISATGNILMFDQAETAETLRFSLDWLRKNKHFTLSCIPVQAYPGSPLYKSYVDKGLIHPLPFLEANCPFPIKPPGLDIDTYRTLFTEYVDYRQTDVYIPASRCITMKTGMESRGDLYTADVTCPHCNKSSIYNNILLSAYTYSGKYVRIGCRHCNRRFDICVSM